MQSSWLEFLHSIDEFKDTEYGDFKREIDAHLRRLVETTPSLTEQQARAIHKLRDEYLWHDHEDEEIESMKRKIRKKILEISEPSNEAQQY